MDVKFNNPELQKTYEDSLIHINKTKEELGKVSDDIFNLENMLNTQGIGLETEVRILDENLEDDEVGTITNSYFFIWKKQTGQKNTLFLRTVTYDVINGQEEKEQRFIETKIALRLKLYLYLPLLVKEIEKNFKNALGI